ncbi:helix-turn-helix domain-containing protein [Streptomyces sp. NPDC047453]|uniref:helix-turn-helix domain-containing protein n=1 Tax=Streptomyces sp. NPDC047453 TaxID=3154812 RepID=UPI0033DE1629
MPPYPFVLAGPCGDTVVVRDCSPRLAEPLVRANVLALGGAAALATHPVTAGRLAGIGVPGSVSACLGLGERFLAAVDGPGSSPERLAAALGGELVATGRALGLHRNTVTARLRQVRDRIGVDLDDPGHRLALQMACRAVQPAPE